MKITSVILFFFLNNALSAQQFIWTTKINSSPEGIETARSVAVDEEGFIYVTGQASKTAYADTFTIDHPAAFYLIKYSPEGKVVWVRQAMGAGVPATVKYENGNLYLCGKYFYGGIQFTDDNDTISFPIAQKCDSYIVSYSKHGKLKWARRLTSTGEINTDGGLDVKDGKIYVLGWFEKDALLQSPGNSINFTSTAEIKEHLLIASYDTSGNLLWAKMEGGVWPGSIVIDNVGDVYATAELQVLTEDAVFGEAPNTTTLINKGGSDIVFLKYKPTGELIWVKGWGGTATDLGKGLSIDHENNLLMAGISWSSLVHFDNHTWNNPGGLYFVAKINSNGELIWIRGNSINNGIGGGNPVATAVDNENNVFVTGNLSFANDLDDGNGGKISINANQGKCFVVKYNKMGIIKWIITSDLSLPDVNTGNGISNLNGNIFLCGRFEGTFQIGDSTFTTNHMGDMFLTKNQG
jgi:hypothetical protein